MLVFSIQADYVSESGMKSSAKVEGQSKRLCKIK